MSDARIEGQADRGARLAAAARRRIARAGADLAFPEADRLGEWQRRSAAALLAQLTRAIEEDLRSSLAGGLAAHDSAHAALSSAQVEIALPLLADAAWEPHLVAILLRRVDEHRLRRAAGETGLLADLAASEDEKVAEAAMAVLIGQSRRTDSFDEPLLAPDDLPAEHAHRLAWTVAAALRSYLVGRRDVDAAAADAALAAAVAAFLAGHDEGQGFEAQALRLARALDEAGTLDDALLAHAAAEGLLSLLLAGLALRSAIALEGCWELLSDPEGAILLLRAAGLARETAGAILLQFHGDNAPTLAAFDRLAGLDVAEAAAGLALWRSDPAYRAAVARLA